MGDLVYPTFMPKESLTESLVQVLRTGDEILIMAAPGWTPEDFDQAVSADILYQPIPAWDYSTVEIDGVSYEVWQLSPAVAPEHTEGEVIE